MTKNVICFDKKKIYILLFLSFIYINICIKTNNVNNKKPDVYIYNIILWIPWLLIWYIIIKNNTNILPISIVMFFYLLLINLKTVIYNIEKKTLEEKNFFNFFIIFLTIITTLLCVSLLILSRNYSIPLLYELILVSIICFITYPIIIKWQEKNIIVDGPGYMLLPIIWICMIVNTSIIKC